MSMAMNEGFVKHEGVLEVKVEKALICGFLQIFDIYAGMGAISN